MKLAKRVLQAVNNFFSNSGHRKKLYRDYLADLGEKPSIPPQYYEERWGSFYNCLIHLDKWLAHLAGFVLKYWREADNEDRKKPYLKKLKNILVKTAEDNSDSMAKQAKHVSTIQGTLHSLVESTEMLKLLTDYLEKTSVPRVHRVYDKLITLKLHLENLEQKDSGWKSATSKLKKYLNPAKNPSISFLQACRIFDPNRLDSLKHDLSSRRVLSLTEYAKLIPILQAAYDNAETREKLARLYSSRSSRAEPHRRSEVGHRSVVEGVRH